MKWIKVSDVAKLPDEPLLLYCAEFDKIYYEDSGVMYGAHPIYTHFMVLSDLAKPKSITCNCNDACCKHHGIE